MKTLRTLLTLTLVGFLGAAVNIQAALKTTPSQQELLFTNMATTEDVLKKATDLHTTITNADIANEGSIPHKAVADMNKVYKDITDMVENLMFAYYTHQVCTGVYSKLDNQAALATIWKGFEGRCNTSYTILKDATLTACEAFLTSALITTVKAKITTGVADVKIFNIKVGHLSVIQTLFTPALSADNTIEIFMANVTETIKQLTEKAVTHAPTVSTAKSTSSWLWRSAKATVKLAALGLALYGADVASGGMLSTLASSDGLISMLKTLIAKPGIDAATLTTYLCSFGAFAKYLPDAFAKYLPDAFEKYLPDAWLPDLCAA